MQQNVLLLHHISHRIFVWDLNAIVCHICNALIHERQSQFICIMQSINWPCYCLLWSAFIQFVFIYFFSSLTVITCQLALLHIYNYEQLSNKLLLALRARTSERPLRALSI
jgi:hypothetical protein